MEYRENFRTPARRQTRYILEKEEERRGTVSWRNMACQECKCPQFVPQLPRSLPKPSYHEQVPNDYLGLRQPIRITSLTYLSPSASTSHHHILTGTQLGDVRRYDTRAARRPTADWKGIGKIGGVKVVEKGLEEQSVFPSFRGQLSNVGL
jgi:hypothetical protein